MTLTRDPILVIAVMLGWLLWILFGELAHAHDPARPDLDRWYQGLQSRASGHCCSKSDAKSLDGSDWDMKDGHYRVLVDGSWMDVPENALVKEPNLVGHALVWVYYYSPMGGVKKPLIRCFMPGTMS